MMNDEMNAGGDPSSFRIRALSEATMMFNCSALCCTASVLGCGHTRLAYACVLSYHQPNAGNMLLMYCKWHIWQGCGTIFRRSSGTKFIFGDGDP